MHLEWVSNTILSQDVLNLIEDNFLLVQKKLTSLITGAYHYFYIIEPLEGTTEEIIQLTISRARDISYDPLSFSLVLSEDKDILLQREIAQGIKEILNAYLLRRISIPVEGMEVTYLQNPVTITLTPFSDGENYLYMSEKEREVIFQEVGNLEEIAGYRLYSSHPLIWFYLKANPTSIPLKEWNTMALTKTIPEEEVSSALVILPNPAIQEQRIVDVDLEIRSLGPLVSSLEREGYFLVENPIREAEEIYRQVAEMWGMEVYGNWVYRNMAGSEQGEWMNSAVRNILSGSLPIVYVGGDWVQYVEPTRDNRIILQAAANLAYQELGKTTNASLLDYEPIAMPNLLLALYLSSQEEKERFLEIFTRTYLPQTGNWRVKVVEEGCYEQSPLCINFEDEMYLVTLVDTEDLYPEIPDRSVPPPLETREVIEPENEPIISLSPEGLLSVDNIPLATLKNPEKGLEGISFQDLISPWGKSYILWKQPLEMDRSLFYSEEILSQL